MNKPISYRAPAYALIFPRVAETVRPLGYAAAIHGSMANDLDIVLVPWTDEAAEPRAVAQVVYEMIEACFGERRLALHGPEQKPHGRMAWTVPLLAGCAVDLSIMPAAQGPEQARDAEKLNELRVQLAAAEANVSHLSRMADCWLALRDVPDDFLGMAGIPCVAMPDGPKSGKYVSGDDAEAAVRAVLAARTPRAAAQGDA